MGFNVCQQGEYDRHLSALRNQEAEALAMALSTLMVFSFNTTETKKYIIAEVQENSKIIRHNKHITTRDNKLKRFRELAAKKRLTKEEQAEAVKLQTYLEREVRKERKCPTTQTP